MNTRVSHPKSSSPRRPTKPSSSSPHTTARRRRHRVTQRKSDARRRRGRIPVIYARRTPRPRPKPVAQRAASHRSHRCRHRNARPFAPAKVHRWRHPPRESELDGDACETRSAGNHAPATTGRGATLCDGFRWVVGEARVLFAGRNGRERKESGGWAIAFSKVSDESFRGLHGFYRV